MARKSKESIVAEQTEGTGTTTTQDPHERVSIMFGLPFEMKQLLQQKADEHEDGDGEKGVPLAEFIRDLLADAIGYTIPARTSKRTKQYASEEDKKAAQKARAKDRRANIKALMALYESDPTVAAKLAEIKAAQAAEAAQEAEGAEESSEESE